MQKTLIKIALVTVLTLLFNDLFWGEKLGLNLIIYGLLAGGGMLLLNPEIRTFRTVQITGAGTLLAMIFLLLHGSGAARFAVISSTMAFFGFALQPELRSLAASLLTIITNLFFSLRALFAEIPALSKAPQPKTRLRSYLAISIVPLIFVALFWLIFKGANPRFAALSDSLFSSLETFLQTIFAGISLPRLMFVLLGLFLSLGLIFNARIRNFLGWEKSETDTLTRARLREQHRHRLNLLDIRMLGLKREYRAAMILVVLVNILALVANIIDISWIWFGFEVPDNFSLKQFVHEGTYLLILSILLSMGIMFYYFRGNQNFYKQNRPLRIACKVWIVQNVIMLFSVFLRNYHYIDYHGLAYKRIGVIFFLAITLFGLWTLWNKIERRRTFFHIFRVNAWATYAAMLLIAGINWDMFIAKYNVSRIGKADIDIPFLLKLSDKTLPYLDQHREVFSYNAFKYGDLNRKLDYRIRQYKVRQEEYSWRSWTLADARTANYFDRETENQRTKP